MPVQALFVVLGDHPTASVPPPEPPKRSEPQHGLWRYKSKQWRCRCEICVAAKKVEKRRAKERTRSQVA